MSEIKTTAPRVSQYLLYYISRLNIKFANTQDYTQHLMTKNKAAIASHNGNLRVDSESCNIGVREYSTAFRQNLNPKSCQKPTKKTMTNGLPGSFTFFPMHFKSVEEYAN